MEYVALKTGQRVALPTLRSTMMDLLKLMESSKGQLAAYELRELCRDPDHELFNPATEDTLKRLSLLGGDGKVLGPVRAVVEAALVGGELDLRVVWPTGLTEEIFASDGSDDVRLGS